MSNVTRFETESVAVATSLTDVAEIFVVGQPVTLTLELENNDAADDIDQFQIQLKPHENGAYHTWLDSADMTNQLYDSGIATLGEGEVGNCHVDMTRAGAPYAIKIRAAGAAAISAVILRGGLSSSSNITSGNHGIFKG